MKSNTGSSAVTSSKYSGKDWFHRICRWSSRAPIYLLLLSGSMIFVWPFLWMATSSVKLDREMFAPKLRLWPQRPVPAVKSPYIDPLHYRDVEGERMPEVLGMIERSLRTNAQLLWPGDVDREAAVTQAARGIFEKLQTLIPSEEWNLAPAELERAVASRIDQKMLDQVMTQIRRRLAIGKLLARSVDLQEDELVAPDQVAGAWKIEGPAKLVPETERGKAFAALDYDFGSNAAAKITLSNTFTTRFPIDRLHKLQLYLCPDNSWHAVTLYVEKLGKRLKAVRPNYLQDFTWGAYTWQEPGPDDLSNKIKTWVLLEEVPVPAGTAVENDPHKIKLTLEIERNSPAGAWKAKILRNYRLTFDHVPFWRYVSTSLFLVILNILLTLFSCSLVAYSFARLQWPGRAFSFALMLATMMIPGQVTMIPHFLILRWLGWYNTLYPLWMPSLFAGAFNVFLLRQFLKGIPRDLEDAAKIDGCGYWRVYWHVMLPLVRPTLAAIAIFTFMGTWNDFMGPLIYLNDQRLYPLSLGLFALNVQTGGGAGSMGIMMAGSLLMTLPVIAIFFLAQRYFLQGVTLTGMKG